MKINSFAQQVKKEVREHLFHYLLLFTAGLFFLVLLSVFRGSWLSQLIVLGCFVLFYIFWGIIHHLIEQTLHFKIVLEYILIGAIAFFILEILLVR